METTEGFEGHLRDVLHGVDDQAAGFTAAQVIAKGRARRRARTATVSGVALVAAGAVAVVPSTVGGAHSHSRTNAVSAAAGASDPARTPDPAQAATSAPPGVNAVNGVPNPPASAPWSSASTSTSTSTSASAPATPVSPSPGVRVVPPGTVALGDGYTVKLTSDSMTLAGDGGQVGPLFTDNGNQGPDSIGLQQCGRVVSGLYIGSGEPATGTVTVDGKAYPATIITLAGHPGWSVAYAVLPANPSTTSKMEIKVSDKAGHVLAALAPPQAH